MIKAVIFDWGGVVADNPADGWLGSLAKMLEMEINDLKLYWNPIYYDFNTNKIDELVFWQRLENSLGLPLPDKKSQVWIKGGAFSPHPEMIKFINELHVDGFRMAVLSNTVPPMTIQMRSLGLYDVFDIVILSDEVGIAKPNPAIYQITADSLGVLPAECLFVDDLPNNLIPALKLGMHTVLASSDCVKTIEEIRSFLG